MKRKLGVVICGLLLSLAAVLHADLLDDGWAAYNDGDYEQAYDLFSKAFREDPASVRANFALGEAASKRGKYSHAVFAYDRVLMADPNHQKARYGKAKALAALGQDAEARAEYAALLNMNLDSNVRSSVEKEIKAIDKKGRELKLNGEISLAIFYDDNINFGPSDGSIVVPANRRNKTWGFEAGAAVYGEYDIGQKGGWTAIGSASVKNSWDSSASAQELCTTKVRAGARKLEQDDLYEAVARVEMITYGHDELVDIYALDGAWLHAKTSDDYLITRASFEIRDYDNGIDPTNARDSFYLKAGETWKHFFENRKNNIALGAEAFMEEADKGFNSNNGLRLLAEGERELFGGIIGYAGGRYRLTDYEDAAVAGNPERADDRYDVIVGAKKKIMKNCTLDLRHQYIRNDSNIAVSDYDRHRTSLTATFEF